MTDIRSTIQRAKGKRPFDKEQSSFERAWNKGDKESAFKIANNIPDKSLRMPLLSLLSRR